jgi:hypothetical protein
MAWTVLDRTQLIEVFRDEHGVCFVNSVPYFDSGDDSPGDNGEVVPDAVWLGDLDILPPVSSSLPSIAAQVISEVGTTAGASTLADGSSAAELDHEARFTMAPGLLAELVRLAGYERSELFNGHAPAHFDRLGAWSSLGELAGHATHAAVAYRAQWKSKNRTAERHPQRDHHAAILGSI